MEIGSFAVDAQSRGGRCIALQERTTDLVGKILAPGLRIGWALVPEHLQRRFYLANEVTQALFSLATEMIRPQSSSVRASGLSTKTGMPDGFDCTDRVAIGGADVLANSP